MLVINSSAMFSFIQNFILIISFSRYIYQTVLLTNQLNTISFVELKIMQQCVQYWIGITLVDKFDCQNWLAS